MTYYTQTGDVVTSDQIKAAVEAGTARVIYSYNFDGGTDRALALDSEDIDTRGECCQMSEEVWSAIPTLAEALKAARA